MEIGRLPEADGFTLPNKKELLVSDGGFARPGVLHT